MAVTTHHLWLLSLSVFAAVEPIRSVPGYHYHRYMLSDYKPQHTHSLQTDYKPVARPTYSESNELDFGDQPGEPEIKLVGKKKRVMLSSLLMRIYHDKTFRCMGVLLNQTTVITVSFCVDQLHKENITITTLSHDVLRLASDPARDSDSRLYKLTLEKPVDSYKGDPQFCTLALQEGKRVQLPEYRRATKSVANRVSEIMLEDKCRHTFNGSQIDNSVMYCVPNEEVLAGCGMTYGNPMIYNGQICGMNWSGHNCGIRGTDQFVPVADTVEIKRRVVNLVSRKKFEEILV